MRLLFKDDQGKEAKARVKDIGDVKAGDNVTIQSGKVKKSIKPKNMRVLIRFLFLTNDSGTRAWKEKVLRAAKAWSEAFAV